MKLGRNELCICGSGRKVKHCCGVDALRDRLRRVGEVAEELLALGYHFPRLRPDTAAFDAWAWTAPEDPDDEEVAAGLATLDDAARMSIIGGFAREQPSAWESLLAEFDNDELAAEIVLLGGVAAGIVERHRPLDESLWLLELDEEVAPVTALATAIPGEDLWSVIESGKTAAELDRVPDDLDDDEYTRRCTEVLEATMTSLWTPWHDERLATLCERLRRRLPDREFPQASAILLEALEDVERLRPRLASVLLSDSLDRLYAAA